MTHTQIPQEIEGLHFFLIRMNGYINHHPFSLHHCIFTISSSMDPLGVSASIITIATISVQVAKGLYKLADGIRIAGKEVSIAAGQVRSFSTLLMSIHNEVSKPTQISPFEQTLILDIVSVYWPDATFDKFTAST